LKNFVFKTLPIEEAEELMGSEIKYTPITMVLLGGDRIVCCDEAVVMRSESDDLIGIATISSQGEDYSGDPEIVGLYILPEYRGQGYAKELLKKTIERCTERGFKKICLNVLSKKMMQVINKLPAEMKEILEVSDQSDNPLIDMLSESER